MPKPVFIDRTILFGDCDPAGIVYTPRFSYFALEAVHEALGVWLEGPGLRALMAHDILPPARALVLEFLHPVSWDDVLRLKVSVAEVGEHAFTFAVEGRLPTDVLAFTARLTQVCVCPRTKTVVAIPAPLRAVLAS
ncbi:acyl-CoA thioesterase [Pseudomonas xantholysinigenes]|uniref:Acyl-CoA thioesterase n=1 Tax=Pseudomonas xantholysinigenes TaxID=2745490 RepID=A0A9E6TYP3_9PSED|nr:thioesterase family protein [Pseudomonas xantholysinigenes]QXI40673.1 acyl-CoA thioesterase [Pseudomonas xantholysinigenes]